MDYDSIYHKLFSNPELVEDLFHHFVTEDWVEQIDFTTLQRINAKFHSDYLERREGDMIYRARMKSSSDTAYLCILMEFQSTSSPWMPVRILAYIALFYQQLIKENQLTKKKRLPPVFPLVLYNGDRHWCQPVQMSSLINLPKGAKLWAYQPQLRYYLIDESRHPKGKENSLSGILFKLENIQQPREALWAISELIQALEGLPNAERLGHDFKLFIQHVLKPNMQLELPLEHMESLNEVQSMLSNRIDEWQQQWRQEGRLLGEAEILKRLLNQRFSEIPATIEQRIANATQDELEAWSLKLFDAKTLTDVFKS